MPESSDTPAFRPGDFFDARALPEPTDATVFYDSLVDGSFFAPDALPRSPEQRAPVTFFRGQRDASWGIVSSLYRHLHEGKNPHPQEGLMGEAESDLIGDMREQDLGRGMNDGQLQSVLQHHGIPTRLIDVSRGALEALFFATDKEDGTNGRLFFIKPPEDYDQEFFAARTPLAEAQQETGSENVALREGQPLFWRSLTLHNWRLHIYAIQDPSLDPRMQAQQGLFLAGGLPVRYGGWAGLQHDGEWLSLEDTAMLCNLALVWPTVRGAGRLHSPEKWAAWSVRIPGWMKPHLRKLLKDRHKIDEESMYPKYQETERLGVHLARTWTRKSPAAEAPSGG